MRRLVGLGVSALAVLWLVVTAGPAVGQGSGSVTATVQVQAAACITISPSSFSYAPAALSTSTLVTTLPATTRPVVANCSSGAQNYLAKGGTATGGSASWSLESSFDCSVPQNDRYKHEFRPSGGMFQTMTTADQTVESGVPASQSRTLDTRLTMPCGGSGGTGQTMSIPITITAVVQ